MSDIKFVEGMVVRPPAATAPTYVKASLSMRRQQLIQWLHDQHDEWVNVEIKQAQSGKWYAAVSDWKPKGDSSQAARSAPAQLTNTAPADDGFLDDGRLPF